MGEENIFFGDFAAIIFFLWEGGAIYWEGGMVCWGMVLLHQWSGGGGALWMDVLLSESAIHAPMWQCFFSQN